MVSKIVEEYGDERAAEALKQGLEQGAQQNAIETAKKMLIKKYPTSDISELMGLPLKEVLELQKKHFRRSINKNAGYEPAFLY